MSRGNILKLKCLKISFTDIFLVTPIILVASVMSWPSYTAKLFEGPASPIEGNVTQLDKIFLGSAPSIGTLVGTSIGSRLLLLMGKKNLLTLAGIIIMSSWALLGTTSHLGIIHIIRMFPGISAGIYVVVMAKHYNEVTDSSIGSAIGIAQSVYDFGTLLSYIIGCLFSYYIVIYINVAASFVYILLTYFIRDISKNQFDLTRNPESTTISRVLNDSGVSEKYQVAAPTAGIEVYQQTVQDNSLVEISELSPIIRKVISVFVQVVIISNSVACLALQIYVGPLFSKAVPMMSADRCSVLLAAVLFLGSVEASVFHSNTERRKLVLYGCTVCALSMGMLSVLEIWALNSAWILPLFVIIYIFFFNIGPGSVSQILVTEYYKDKVRGLASTILLESSSTAVALLALFPVATEYLGIGPLFCILTVISISTIPIVYLITPKTRNIKLKIVQQVLRSFYAT